MEKHWSPSILTPITVLYFILLVGWSYLLSFNNLQTSSWNYLFNVAVGLFYILAFGIAIWHSRQPQVNKPARRTLVYLGLGALASGLGFIIWAYYNLILQNSVPYPSIADLFFLLSYPILGVALWNLHRSYESQVSPRGLRQSVLIVGVSAIVILVFLNRPDLSPDLGLGKNLLNVGYSLGDVLLVAMALIELRSGQAKKYSGLYMLILFLLLQAGGDFTFAYLNNAQVYWNGDIADLLFGASAFALTLAVLQNNLLKSSTSN